VTGTGPLPDLESLSAAQKDRLIVELWEELQRERARPRDPPARSVPEPSRAGASASRDGRTPSSAASAKVRLGSGLGLFRAEFLVGAAVVLGLLCALDYGIGWYQQRRLEQRRLAELRLEQAAFSALLVQLVNVAYEPDGKSYRLTMSMENLDPEQPVYVMLSPVRVFEQSGLAWREVPARAPDGQDAAVVKLTGRRIYETVFEPNLKDWTELMPGYMHIRFQNDMLISQRSEPEDDLVERDDPYYVYLKPFGADDEAIRKRMKYAGAPPVYIPMLPH